MLLRVDSSLCLSPLDNVIHFSLLFTMVSTVLFFSLRRKSVKDALLDLRMTACFYPPPQRYLGCLIRLVQKEMHFPTILVGPLCSITKKCPSSLSSKDNNFPFLYTTSVMTETAAVPQGCSRSRKRRKKKNNNSMLLWDIEGLLDHQPIFLHSHLLTHFSLNPPLHTLHVLSYWVAVA